VLVHAAAGLKRNEENPLTLSAGFRA